MNDMKMTELREYARSIGIQPQQHETRESLLFRIAQQAYPEAAQEPSNVEQQAVVYTQKEQLLDSIAHFIKQGLEANFYDNDSTWHFKYRGTEDSGSMTMPMSIIIRKAESVGKGAFVPRILRGTGSELDGALG